MKLVNVLIVLLFLAIVGCQSNPANKAGFFSGNSHADPTLKKDIMKIATLIVNAKGCKAIDHVKTKVQFYEPSNGQQGHEWGKESWTALGCSKSFPLAVSLSEDGNGGTYFSVSGK